MRGLKSTLFLAVVLLGLGAYIYFVESKREPGEADKKPKVFAVESAKINELTVKASNGDTTSLTKDEGTWMLTAPIASSADEAEVSGITTNLQNVEIQRVIDEQPKDLAAYGLATPRVDVSFKAEGATGSGRLLLGDKTPTGGDLYAKLADQPKVFLVSGFLDSTFDRKTFDLRDKTVVKFTRDKVDTIEVVGAERTLRFRKTEDQWRLAEPVDARADFGAVEGVIGRLGSGQMKSLVEAEAADLAKYGLDKPEFTVTLGGGGTKAAIAFGKKADDGSVYAKDGARPMVFTVDGFMTEEFKKTADDFRPKDLFEFRTFSGSRVEVAKPGAPPRVFEKRPPAEPTTAEEWMQTSPSAKIEASKIVDALSKLSNLRADSFVAALPKGATEALTVKANFAAGKKNESVTFYKAGDDVYATRSGDNGAAKVAAGEFDGALKDVDDLK